MAGFVTCGEMCISDCTSLPKRDLHNTPEAECMTHPEEPWGVGTIPPQEQEDSSHASSGFLNLDVPMDAATERFNLLHETMRRMHLEMIRQFSILQVCCALIIMPYSHLLAYKGGMT